MKRRFAAFTKPWLDLPLAARIPGDCGLAIGSIAGPVDEPTIAACGECGVPIIRVMIQIDPASYADRREDKPRIYGRMRRDRWDQLGERETLDAIRHYRAYCTHMDDLFGRLLDALDRTGQAEDTLVLQR